LEILKDYQGWLAAYRSGWLNHFNQTGKVDWSKYPLLRNNPAPEGTEVRLNQARLVLISSAGAYLRDKQEPFDAANLLGDYSMRLLPTDGPHTDRALAHTHYDHTAVNADPQVLLPIQHLKRMVANRSIGSLGEQIISFMGYQPDITRVVDELIPEIIRAVKNQNAQAAFLVPA